MNIDKNIQGNINRFQKNIQQYEDIRDEMLDDLNAIIGAELNMSAFVNVAGTGQNQRNKFYGSVRRVIAREKMKIDTMIHIFQSWYTNRSK